MSQHDVYSHGITKRDWSLRLASKMRSREIYGRRPYQFGRRHELLAPLLLFHSTAAGMAKLISIYRIPIIICLEI